MLLCSKLHPLHLLKKKKNQFGTVDEVMIPGPEAHQERLDDSAIFMEMQVKENAPPEQQATEGQTEEKIEVEKVVPSH